MNYKNFYQKMLDKLYHWFFTNYYTIKDVARSVCIYSVIALIVAGFCAFTNMDDAASLIGDD